MNQFQVARFYIVNCKYKYILTSLLRVLSQIQLSIQMLSIIRGVAH